MVAPQENSRWIVDPDTELVESFLHRYFRLRRNPAANPRDQIPLLSQMRGSQQERHAYGALFVSALVELDARLAEPIWPVTAGDRIAVMAEERGTILFGFLDLYRDFSDPENRISPDMRSQISKRAEGLDTPLMQLGGLMLEALAPKYPAAYQVATEAMTAIELAPFASGRGTAA